MARFRKNPETRRKRTNLTIDPKVWEKAQDMCYDQGISVSELVNDLLREKIREVERIEEDRKAFDEAQSNAIKGDTLGGQQRSKPPTNSGKQGSAQLLRKGQNIFTYCSIRRACALCYSSSSTLFLRRLLTSSLTEIPSE